MGKKPTPFPVRLSGPVYAAVRRLAETEDRSINYILAKLIEKGIPPELLDECRADISPALAGDKS